MSSFAYNRHLQTSSNSLLHSHTSSNNLHLDMLSRILCDNETKGVVVIQQIKFNYLKIH